MARVKSKPPRKSRSEEVLAAQAEEMITRSKEKKRKAESQRPKRIKKPKVSFSPSTDPPKKSNPKVKPPAPENGRDGSKKHGGKKDGGKKDGSKKDQKEANGTQNGTQNGMVEGSEAPKRIRREHLQTPFRKEINQAQKQLTIINRELALLEAYEGDGWKGASKDKFKPTTELKRARHQIRRSKDIIRQCLKACEDVPGLKALPATAFDSEGEIEANKIFCCRCKKKDSRDDNDIVLCDGSCNRAYHEKCCDPPFVAADLPEDCLWLCPACDAKAEIVDAINDVLETDYEIEQPWHEILPPEADAMANGTASSGWLSTDWPSDDEHDSDFDVSEKTPEKGTGRKKPQEKQQHADQAQSPRKRRSSAAHARSSASRSTVQADDDSDESCSSSDSDASDVEIVEEDARALAALGGPLDSDDGSDGQTDGRKRRTRSSYKGRKNDGDSSEDDELAARARAALEAEDNVDPATLIVEGKRRRKKVDYAALAAVVFKDGLIEEKDDGDWSPSPGAKT